MISNDGCVVTNGNVVLVDPNCVNLEHGLVNEMPPYEKMHIYADLTATRKGRTVFESGVGISTDESITVNMMGFNQDKDSPDYGMFTTNYYDGSTGNRKNYESFGIESIKITINSSFIPQVNINFIDVRGLSFFNNQPDGEDSPYRILFDFPPPIFRLTVKGYYGKAVSYDLHLVKYTTDFKSDNGNFHIDAQFVALTFAPLADILFRYVINFPLINGEKIDPDSKKAPINTYDLITKVKKLLNADAKFRETDTDNDFYDEIRRNDEAYQQTLNQLITSLDNPTLNSGTKTPIFLIEDDSEENIELKEDIQKYRKLNSGISEYNQIILNEQRTGVGADSPTRLYIAYNVGNIFAEIEDDDTTSPPTIWTNRYPDISISYARRVNAQLKLLDEFRESLILNASNSVRNRNENMIKNLIKKPTAIRTSYGLDGYDEENVYIYAVLDITEIYTFFYKELAKIRDDKGGVISRLNTKINTMILEELGMIPTVYNVFKIILNDVDKMFNILRRYSKDAYNHHNNLDIKNLIINSDYYRDIGANSNVPDINIYSFPLVIDKVNRDGVTREERVAPIKISDSLGAGNQFPELTLIQRFIDSFKYQSDITRQLNLRMTQNVDGTFVWIPIAPFDSKLYSTNVSSPYLGIDGVNALANSSGEDKISQIMNIAIKRFYILTQFVLPESYEESITNTNGRSAALVKLFAESEALNIGSAIRNEELRNLLKRFANRYNSSNVEDFNRYANSNFNQIYNLRTDAGATGSNVEFRDYLLSDKNIYVNKNNSNYEGCFLILGRSFSVTQAIDKVVSDENKDPNRPIYEFRNEIKRSWWNKLKFWDDGNPDERFGYLEENLFYIKDGEEDGSVGNVNYKTRYVSTDRDIWMGQRGIATSGDGLPDNTTYNLSGKHLSRRRNKISLINDIITINPLTNEYNGNKAILDATRGARSDKDKLDDFQSIMQSWVDTLPIIGEVDDITNFEKVYPILSNPTDKKFASIILLSNFGYTNSPFNRFPNDYNTTIFSTPSVIQLPRFVAAYIGALVDIDVPGEGQEIDPNSMYGKLYNFFVNGEGKFFNSGGFFIFADIVDIKNSLSLKDKNLFRKAYDDFISRNFLDDLLVNFEALYDEFILKKNEITSTKRTGVDRVNELKGKYIKLLEELLSPDNGTHFNLIMKPLLESNYLLIDSEITFKPNSQSPTLYTSMSNSSNNYSAYFEAFFNKLANSLDDIEDAETDRQNELRNLSDDVDIINQTYYSFKNINDKWLTNPPNRNVSGFTYNDESGRLIDLFAFVDRAMNPAGDTIINPEVLVDLMDDPNVSLYGVLSQLLSANGFEFFPLQNFMSFEANNAWEDSFKIDDSGRIDSSPNFVCMYIGGSSSYITGISRYKNFTEDGIVDLTGPGLGKDFVKSDDVQDNPERDNQKAGNRKFPWGDVRAFRVRFAQQNQSMFKDMKIDSKEFPETNESIQILSRIAGDHRANAPIPKGQNLYNLYENRAYSATISGLGNMMIQPTQYFQLENVPLYNGAYLILSVEHEIVPNKIHTSFTGTKILKYPIPRVTNPASIFGFDEGATESSNAGMASQNTVTLGGGANTNPDEAKFYSMYEQKIEEK